MTNKDLKFNGRQDAYVDVRFDNEDPSDLGRTVIIETNHGTYALSFMDIPNGYGGNRYGDVDISLFDQEGDYQDITASGWADGRGADLRWDTDEGRKIHNRAATRLIAILSGTIKKKEVNA